MKNMLLCVVARVWRQARISWSLVDVRARMMMDMGQIMLVPT